MKTNNSKEKVRQLQNKLYLTAKKCSSRRFHVLKEVDISRRVYLTRNGHVEYVILTMEEIDELDHVKAAYMLTQKLRAAKERAEKEGWINADDLENNI